MNITHTEINILEKAIERFQDTTGLNLKIIKRNFPTNQKYFFDALLHLRTPEIDRQYIVEVKTRLTQNTLGAAMYQLDKYAARDYPGKKMLVTDYVNPIMAERLKEINIPFMDTAGNIYLNEPPLFIYIKGNKQTEKYKKRPVTKVFQTSGLKILFVLLNRPELVNAPYRDIANTAQVALGTVGWFMRDLKKMGFLIEMGKKARTLIDRKKIIDRWTEAYPEKLRPKLFIGRYKATVDDWWHFTDFAQNEAYWGGEVAAAKLTQYLKPEIQTIYLREKTPKFLIQHGLTHDPKGKIEILKTFWKFENDERQRDIVPKLLIYADLLATGDTRNIETARMIYDKHLT